MKPIWIVDDDQSIRFVLEKALLREGLPTRSFTNPREVLAALAAGIKTVMLPARNRKDLDEVPQEARQHLEFIFLETVAEAAQMKHIRRRQFDLWTTVRINFVVNLFRLWVAAYVHSPRGDRP